MEPLRISNVKLFCSEWRQTPSIIHVHGENHVLKIITFRFKWSSDLHLASAAGISVTRNIKKILCYSSEDLEEYQELIIKDLFLNLRNIKNSPRICFLWIWRHQRMGIVLTNIMSELNPSRGNMSSKLRSAIVFVCHRNFICLTQEWVTGDICKYTLSQFEIYVQMPWICTYVFITHLFTLTL